jgi:multidrug efflux pump subunit AcrB
VRVAVFPIVAQYESTCSSRHRHAIVTSPLVSLVHLTVAPSFASLLLRVEQPWSPGRAPSGLHRFSAVELEWLGVWVQQAYERFTVWATQGRGAAHNAGRLALLGAVCLFFLGSLAFLPSASYLPNGTQGFIFCIAQPTPGQRSAVTSEALSPLEQAALADPRTERIFSVASSFFNGGGGVSKTRRRHLGCGDDQDAGGAGFTCRASVASPARSSRRRTSTTLG